MAHPHRLVALLISTFTVAMLVPVTGVTASAVASAPTAPTPRVVGNQLESPVGTPLRMLGVYAPGTAEDCVSGKGISWGPMNAAEASAIASWHANVVRVPLNEDCWLGINGVPAAYSGAAYQSAIEAWVAELNAAGLVAILDLHWSAPGEIEALGQWPMPDADHSITFWNQVATAFQHDPSVMFDLFNEPYLGGLQPTPADWTCWRDGCPTTAPACPVPNFETCTSTMTYQVAGMQQLVDAVRSAGATQPIMLGGLNWSGDPCGVQDVPPPVGSCAWLEYEPQDPDNQLVASFHTYNWTACRNVTCWNQSVAPLAASVPVVTGELGERNCSSGYVRRYVSWADRNGVSYLASSWEPTQPGETCTAASLHLVAGWLGPATTLNPVGQFYLSHLVKLAG